MPELLAFLPGLDVEGKRKRTKLLWEALREVDQRLRAGAFSGSYSWTYYQPRSATFDAAFVRQLNTTAWVPDAEGSLQRPEFVVFEALGWEENPVLTSKIRFRPPIIDQLALEAGIEPKVLEMLKKRGLTSVAELLAALGEEEQSEPTAPAPTPSEGTAAPGNESPGTVEDALKNLLGDSPPPTPPIPDPTANDPVGTGAGGGGNGTSPAGGSGGAGGRNKGQSGAGSGGGTAPGTPRPRTPGSAGGRPFISYVAARPEEAESDPDGLDQPARMALEAKAIDLILSREPEWRRTRTHNPGFDLYQGDEQSGATRWCEVKAMTGTLADRPVGLSRTQFDCAREHGEAYWLYVVESAGTNHASLARIQDPAGRAKTFTFDHGWRKVAEADDDTAEHCSVLMTLMTKIDITRTELVWPGKYNEDGTLKEVPRVSLPFQVIETVNESRATREAKKSGVQGGLFEVYDGKEGDTFEAGWRNKLIWGDNLLVMGSLLEKFAGKIDLIYIDPPFATGADFSFTTEIGESGSGDHQGAILHRGEGVPRHVGTGGRLPFSP